MMIDLNSEKSGDIAAPVKWMTISKKPCFPTLGQQCKVFEFQSF